MALLHNPDRILMSLKGITLDYNEFRALSNVDLNISERQIHAIVGEHGAGKSSLAAIMSGLQKPQKGTITVSEPNGQTYNLKNAQAAGIRMVYQQTYLNDYFSVGENLFYTAPASSRLGFYSRNRVEESARTYLLQHGFDIDPRVQLHTLSLSERTVIEILKNLYTQPRLLILDEALEKLSTEAFDKIIPILQQMREAGRSVVTITHRIDDVFRLADMVTILKSGNRLITERVDNINKLNLIRMAYTQVGSEPIQAKLDAEFYQFLKYNEAILQHLPVNIIVVDDELTIKMVNEHCIQNFCLAERPYLNKPLDRLLSGESGALQLVRESVRKREAQTYYNVELTIRNSHRVNNIKTFPVFDGVIVIGTILIIEDMTEYDHLQKQLILSEKLASVGLLAAGVAHEINNPLEIISNYLSYLKYSRKDREIHESVDKVNREIEYISRIVSNLVTFSGNRQSSHELVEINEVLREILDLLKYNAEYKHVDVSFVHNADDLWFAGDRDQLKQVILNLIKNSFEAMPEGGEIRIRTELSSPGTKERESRIIFEDTGPGIDAPDLTTVFMPFFSSKPGGKNQLGLGLSISYRIIESFGGEMDVENLPEGGCRFTISLPTPR